MWIFNGQAIRAAQKARKAGPPGLGWVMAGKAPKGLSRVISCVAAISTVACLLLSSGCSQKMDNEPKYIPLRENTFYSDDKSARPLPDGVVPRGYLEEDQAFFTGKTGGTGATAPVVAAPSAQQSESAPGVVTQVPAAPSASPGRIGSPNTIAANLAANVEPKTPGQTDINYFPIPVTPELVSRGQERFNIFCSPCHSYLGDGQGMIVKRGFRQPPSFHIDRLRQAPVGHFFDVITNGFGAMPDYAEQITPQDRWAIIAYIRALQLSQNATRADVPTDHAADLDNQGQQK
jgi:mono/diheme cytochrome c family protein